MGKKEITYKGLLSFSPDIQQGRSYKEDNFIKHETPDVSGLGRVSAHLQHLAHVLAPEREAWVIPSRSYRVTASPVRLFSLIVQIG